MNELALKHALETLYLPTYLPQALLISLAFCAFCRLIDSIIAWHGMVWHGFSTYVFETDGNIVLLALDIHSNLAILSRMDGWMHWFFLLFILRFLSM